MQGAESLINAFVVLFIVVDPIGVAWLFAVLSQRAGRQAQRRMAVRGVSLSALILFTFFFIGAPLLSALGIGIPAFRIAGGVLLFLLAIDMVFARQSGLRSTTRSEQEEAEHRADVSVFPLAFPLIAGPGALTTVLLMTGEQHAPWSSPGMLAVLALVLVLTLWSLLMAPAILRVLGETGANVVSRLLGLVLSALAVQYVLDGIRTAFFEVSG